MTAKIDGTNGVLQQYDYQVPTTGFSYTFAAGTTVLVMNPAGTLATGTITMPAAPADGMTITVESTQQITALTVQGNTGQSLVNGTQTLRPNQPYSWVYRLSNTTWYPFAGATNSQLVLETSKQSTSGTSIDFTGIPAWVKRITVMFSGVSTNAASNILVRLGTGSTPTYATSGYDSTSSYAGTAGVSTATSTVGYVLQTSSTGASQLNSGSWTITNITGNTWVSSGVTTEGATATRTTFSAGTVTLGAVLTAVRITSVTPDTFDAGSINILYE